MFALRREKQQKPRFQVDTPRTRPIATVTAPPRSALPIKLTLKPRPKKRRFQIEAPQTSRWAALPFQLSIQRRRGRRRATLTLAQRRELSRLGLIVGGVIVVVAIIASGLWLNPATHDALFPPAQVAAAVSGSTPGQTSVHGATDHPLHYGAEQPYTNLQSHMGDAAKAPAIQAQAAFVFDPDQGWIVYQQNADAPYPAASLTKIMTMLLAVDTASLDQTVTVGPDAAALVNSDNSYMDLSAGEQLTMRELLYGLIVQGGNDAALAIADTVGGDQATFVQRMNLRARQLGLTHTHFVSADGVDSGNVTSAADMAKLSALVLTRPGVEQITSTYSIAIDQTSTHKLYRLQGSNQLLAGGGLPYSGAIGVKTGYTADAHYCMAFAARVNGRLLVGVVLGEPSPQARDTDAHALLDWGFAQQ